MSQSVLKYDFTRHFWLRKIIKVLNAAKFSNFCCFFSLRQGTIMIAIVELSLSSFCLFLLLLGITHAQDIISLVTSELHQLEENSSAEGNSEESSVYVLNNEKKMLLGRHLAFIIMATVWAGLILTGISFISSALLLYGAVRNSPKFLLPWTSTAFLSLISGSFFIFMLSFVPFKGCKFGLFIIVVLFYGLESYAWLVVLSYYQELKAFQLKNLGGIALYAKTAGKTVTVVIFTVCSATDSSPNKIRTHSPKVETGKISDDTIISLLPLKLLLEYQLNAQREFKQYSDDQYFQQMEKNTTSKSRNSTSSNDLSKQNALHKDGLCTEINLPKNISFSEISNILNSDKNFNNYNLSHEDLRNIYSSLSDCFYIKVRNAKLWGPLWHCLNRLFLFFVFN